MSSWVTPAFDAAVYTASASNPPSVPAPTWVVASGDVTTLTYRLDGKMMTVAFHIITSTVADAPVSLQITIPLGRHGKRTVSTGVYVEDNSTAAVGYVTVFETFLAIALASGANWANATNTTMVAGQIEFEVVTATDTTGL